MKVRAHRFALFLPLLALGLSCRGGRPEKAPMAALWLDEGSVEVSIADRSRLQQVGLSEFFVEAADLVWERGRPTLRPRPAARLPRRTPATLVVRGPWEVEESEAEDAGAALAEALRQLAMASEERGLFVIGFHLDLEAGPRLDSYAQGLAALRPKVGENHFFSATVDRRWLADPALAKAARELDFLVCFLYGQRLGEAEDPEAWDLLAVEANLRRLEALRRPYLLGVVTLGTATLRSRSGESKAVATVGGLKELVFNPAFELTHGFTLQGIDRQVIEFKALGATSVGEWRLAPAESVRVVRTATPFLEEFLRRIGAWELPHRLGEIYYRAPRPGERLSLTLENLVRAIGPEEAVPNLDVQVELRLRSPRLWILRLRLLNLSDEPSDVAFYDHNYVQLSTKGAVFDDVDLGDFHRLEVWSGNEHNTMRAIREADTVRLFVPMLDGQDRLASGDIELKLRSAAPELRSSGAFVLADGRIASPPPHEWIFEER